MDVILGPAIGAYRESISQRTPALDKICSAYDNAANDAEAESRRSALDRVLVKARVLQTYSYAADWKSEWSGSIFGVLNNRASVLEEKWKKKLNVSPRLTQAIAEAMRDCEFVVRYFEERLRIVQKDDAAEKRAGLNFRQELHRVFEPQRDLLGFYEHRVLSLDETHLQEMEMDGKVGKRRRQDAVRDVQAIRARWTGSYHSIPGIDLQDEKAGGHKGGTLDSNSNGNEVRQTWFRHRFNSYTWKYLPNSRVLAEALCLACEEGDVKELTRLLEKGAYVDSFGAQQRTPLICAIRRQRVKVIRLLLKHHADVNKPSSGVTPLLEAVQSKSLEIVEMLVKHGANVDARNFPDEHSRGITALHRAGDLDLPDLVYYLLNQGANFSLTYCDHTANLREISPLHVAKGRCATHIISISTRDRDYKLASARDSRGRVPLIWALEREDWRAVRACDVRFRYPKEGIDVDGNTALHLLCKRLSHLPLPEALIDVTSQVVQMDVSHIRHVNSEGQSPLQMLAALSAHRPRTAGPEDETVFAACKDLILASDLDFQSRKAQPEYYFRGMMYCFGSKPSDEEQEAMRRQHELRESHEARMLVEQTALLESLMAESKA